MTRFAVCVAIASVLLALQAVGHTAGGIVSFRPRQQSMSCNVASFASVLPLEATVEKVAIVPDGGKYGEGLWDEAYPWIPTGLPALCAVTVRVQSSPVSSYRFGLFLPSHEQWKGRFLAVGNGGFAGGINWIDM